MLATLKWKGSMDANQVGQTEEPSVEDNIFPYTLYILVSLTKVAGGRF